MEYRTIRETLGRLEDNRPLYQQLSERLADLIARGALRAGDRLPSERQLTEMSATSRVTVRKALSELTEKGLIEQRHGSGSFVSPSARRTEPVLPPVSSLSDELLHKGQFSRVIWLKKAAVQARFRDMTVLGLDLPEQVAAFERIRFVDEQPLSYERSVFRGTALPDVSMVDQSIYAALDKNGTTPRRVVQEVTAVNMAPSEARRLETLTAAAGLLVTRTGYDAGGVVIEFTQALFRADTYKMAMEFGAAQAPD